MSLSDEENISFNDDRREMSVKGELVGDAGVVEEDNGKAYMKSSLIALHQVVWSQALSVNIWGQMAQCIKSMGYLT